MKVDLLIHSASQLLTLAGGPQRGGELGQLGIIENGAIAIVGERIHAVGESDELRDAYEPEQTIHAVGRVVMPGFVDPHTHLIWAGDRSAEFEARSSGATYMEILAQGGGIISTVKQTRTSETSALILQPKQRLNRMLRHGTTTAEAKTGYGLELETELRMLKAIHKLDERGPVELAPTFPPSRRPTPKLKPLVMRCCPHWWNGGEKTGLERHFRSSTSFARKVPSIWRKVDEC